MSDSWLETDGQRADDDGMPPIADDIGGYCSRCKRRTTAELDQDGDLVSVCCNWPLIDSHGDVDDFLTQSHSDEVSND